MKFAIIKYAQTKDTINVNKIIKKLPPRIYDWFIIKLNPYTLKEVNLLNTEGYEITLPLLYIEKEEKPDKWKIIIDDTLEKLRDMDIKIIVPPKKSIVSNVINMAEGKVAFGFFIESIVKKSLNIIKKDIKISEIVIIDGKNTLTKLIIDCLYPYVNFLSIYTDREENFMEKSEEIFEDTGLTLNIFTSNKNVLMKEADIIINCSYDTENSDYYYKKGAIYIDANKNRPKLKRLISRRSDMLFIDSFSIKSDEQKVSYKVFEATEFIKNKDFRMFVEGEYDKEKTNIILKDFKKRNLLPIHLMVMGMKLLEK